MSTLADDSWSWIGSDQPYLLRNDNIQIMLCLIDVSAHWHDAADAMRIRLGGPRARCVHDAVFRTPQKVGAAAEAVQHTAAHDAGAVRVRVDVDFDGRVHADDAEAADDLGRVGDLLRAQEELGVVVLPLWGGLVGDSCQRGGEGGAYAVVEALEAIR
jgi:hypothetical protein